MLAKHTIFSLYGKIFTYLNLQICLQDYLKQPKKQCHFLCLFLKKKIGGHKSFLWSHQHPCFLLVMSALGFKARLDPFAYSFTGVILTLTFGAIAADCIESKWQPSLFDPHTCRCVNKHWWRFGAWTHDCLCGEHSAVQFGHSDSAFHVFRLDRNLCTIWNTWLLVFIDSGQENNSPRFCRWYKVTFLCEESKLEWSECSWDASKYDLLHHMQVLL